MREQDAAVKWFNTEFYPPLHQGKGHAVRYDDGVLPRLRRSHITFFTPWGPRYNWRQRGSTVVDGDREVLLLRYLSTINEQLLQHFGDKVYRTVIPRNVRLAEAPSFGLPALYHDRESRGTQAYLALAGELMNNAVLTETAV